MDRDEAWKRMKWKDKSFVFFEFRDIWKNGWRTVERFRFSNTFFAARDGKWRSSPSAKNPVATRSNFFPRPKKLGFGTSFPSKYEKTFSSRWRRNLRKQQCFQFSLSSREEKFHKKIFIPPRNNIFFTQLKTRNLNSLINKSKLLWGSRDKGIEAFPPEASFDRKSNRPPSWLNSFAKRIFWLWQEKKKKKERAIFRFFFLSL